MDVSKSPDAQRIAAEVDASVFPSASPDQLRRTRPASSKDLWAGSARSASAVDLWAAAHRSSSNEDGANANEAVRNLSPDGLRSPSSRVRKTSKGNVLGSSCQVLPDGSPTPALRLRARRPTKEMQELEQGLAGQLDESDDSFVYDAQRKSLALIANDRANWMSLTTPSYTMHSASRS